MGNEDVNTSVWGKAGSARGQLPHSLSILPAGPCAFFCIRQRPEMYPVNSSTEVEEPDDQFSTNGDRYNGVPSI
jgi:hypothetical protein